MSTGLHARRATGLTVAKSEESYVYPDRIGGEVAARGAGGVRGRERSSAVVFSVSFYRCKVFQSGRKLLYERDGDVIFFPNFSLSFIVFAVLLCRAVLSLFSYIPWYSIILKEEDKCPTWGM